MVDTIHHMPQHMVDIVNLNAMTSTHPGEALHRLLHAYKRAMREACRETGIDLPPSHIRTMKAIRHLPQCTAHDIATRLRRDKSQITRVVQELCTAGLVRQQSDPSDGRRRILMATKAADRLYTRIARAEKAAGARMVRGLPADAVTRFVQLAEAMAANLDPTE